MLTSVAAFLGIPTSLIEPFLSTAIQEHRHKTRRAAASSAPFSILCVSGVSGSGKTTLSDVLVRSYTASRVGSDAHGRRYLDDLSSDAERWAFETQVAFLVSKASEIRKLIAEGTAAVVERWIDEDISVYERYFHERGTIDQRSHETFQRIAKATVASLPPPEFVLYCRCSAETAIARTHSRRRGDAALHSDSYIRDTLHLYDEWLDTLEGPEVYVLDTDYSDLSTPGVLQAVFGEVQWALTNKVHDPQVSLFDEDGRTPQKLTHLRPYKPARWSRRTKSEALSVRLATPLLSPLAYIAAPFTGFDTRIENDQRQQNLFGSQRPHGIIPRGGFRLDLLAIERALSSIGFSVILPHRDVNGWGQKTMTPEAAMKACTDHVAATDLFVGVLGRSCGAHYEFGLAYAQGKPCIILSIEDLSRSFLAGGVDVLASPDVLHIVLTSLREAESVLSGQEVREFLSRSLDGFE